MLHFFSDLGRRLDANHGSRAKNNIKKKTTEKVRLTRFI